MTNNNNLLYYIEQQKYSQPNKRKRAQEDTPSVSRFFSFILATLTLKTNISISATYKVNHTASTPTPAPQRQERISTTPSISNTLISAQAPAAAVTPSLPQMNSKTATPLPSTQNTSSFFSPLTNIVKGCLKNIKNYVDELDQDDIEYRKLKNNDPIDVAAEHDSVESLLRASKGINTDMFSPATQGTEGKTYFNPFRLFFSTPISNESQSTSSPRTLGHS